MSPPWHEQQRQAADPLAVPAHAPLQLAKNLATIDQLSTGRMAGLGAGWSSDELQTVRATLADRGRRGRSDHGTARDPGRRLASRHRSNQFEATAQTWERVRDLAAAHGRDVSQMELIVVGNVTFADHPLPAGRVPFTGTLDHIVEDIVAASAAGADPGAGQSGWRPRRLAALR